MDEARGCIGALQATHCGKQPSTGTCTTSIVVTCVGSLLSFTVSYYIAFVLKVGKWVINSSRPTVSSNKNKNTLR